MQDPVADQARREWLNLREGELPPRVLQAVFPSLVIWASLWPGRPDGQIRFDIEDQRLTWTLLGEPSDEDEKRLDQLRNRLNDLINADLCYTFGQSHQTALS